MPDELIKKLKGQAKKGGVSDTNAYVYGTLRRLGWKPKREGGDEQIHPNPNPKRTK